MKRPAHFSVRHIHSVLPVLIVSMAALGMGAPVLAQSSSLSVVNGDHVPFPGRLVFSRIGSVDRPPMVNGVHDVGLIRIENMGSEGLGIESLVVDGPFELVNPPDLPLAVLSGSSVEINIRFTAASGDLSGERRGLHAGSLSVGSSASATPASVDFVGYWQKVSEGGLEPPLSQIVTDIFGYSTQIVFPGEHINNNLEGTETTGEEVLSPYWKVAEPSTPVIVQALASFFRCCTEPINLSWYEIGDTTTAASIVTIAASDAQTVLPRVEEGEGGTGFTPAASTAFGFVAEDTIWSDPLLNSDALDDCAGSREACGRRIRFWPATDGVGIPIPHSYIMAAELSTSGDFNDAVFLVSNITPSMNSTGVADRQDEEVPSFYALQNYPNPFNPSTVIRYTLPAYLDVSLAIYDAAGRHVTTLVQGEQQAGEYHVAFDAGGLSSGIYV
ncbi:MAG: T9SS type A sorting domain-containing protein, partial [Rhodothermales bacterium]